MKSIFLKLKLSEDAVDSVSEFIGAFLICAIAVTIIVVATSLLSIFLRSLY